MAVEEGGVSVRGFAGLGSRLCRQRHGTASRDSTLFTQLVYDGVNRETKRYLAYETDESSYSDAFFEPVDQDTIDVLDIVHVTKYVWLAAKAFWGANREQAEALARDRLLRILPGDVSVVVFGLR